MKNKPSFSKSEKLTMAQKEANDFAWYREKIDMLDASHNSLGDSYGGISEYRRMRVNYDLFNDKINLQDLQYVCRPFGDEVGELPADMRNRDIISGKIKVILGMENKRPFDWNIIAVNPEATTRREEETFNYIKQYVTEQIMLPIRQQIMLQKQQELQGRELTPQEQQEIQKQIEEELQAKTPEQVKKYMMNEYQDPAEIQAHQLLEYLLKKQDLPRKFNTALKHGLIAGKQAMYVGILNGEPVAWNVNSMRINYTKSPDTNFIEESEEISVEYRMTTSEVVRYFGDELTDAQITKLYENSAITSQNILNRWFESDEEAGFIDPQDMGIDTHRVLHGTWKALRKVCFLTYIDREGNEQVKRVSENYKLQPEYGDKFIEHEWLPETYETWKIDNDIYVNKRPLPGQIKNMQNLWETKSCYYGVIYDNMNSRETSLVDRMKYYQYLYNIIIYRIELLTSSDKGKKILMNIKSIPSSSGLTMKKWQYFSETTPYMWFDNDEEGNNYQDVNTVAKVLDLSLASDIGKYIEIAEYLRQQCGRSVGITDQMEGQISQREAVGNTQQALVQSAYILEPYFELHNYFKRNVLQAMIETAKVAYSVNKPDKLMYVLDDMSVQMLDLDINLLDMSEFGIFVSNSTKIEEVKNMLTQLSHAAMQNGKAELSDVLSIVKLESITEAENILKLAEQKRQEQEQNIQKQQNDFEAEQADKQRQFIVDEHEREKEKIILKEEERRKTVVVQNSLMGASFNPDLDKDSDGKNDFIEIAKEGLNANITTSKMRLEREKFEHQKSVDAAKLQNDKEKIIAQKNKASK